VAVCAPARARGHAAGRRARCRCATERATGLKARVLHARAWNSVTVEVRDIWEKVVGPAFVLMFAPAPTNRRRRAPTAVRAAGLRFVLGPWARGRVRPVGAREGTCPWTSASTLGTPALWCLKGGRTQPADSSIFDRKMLRTPPARHHTRRFSTYLTSNCCVISFLAPVRPVLTVVLITLDQIPLS